MLRLTLRNQIRLSMLQLRLHLICNVPVTGTLNTVNSTRNPRWSTYPEYVYGSVSTGRRCLWPSTVLYVMLQYTSVREILARTARNGSKVTPGT